MAQKNYAHAGSLLAKARALNGQLFTRLFARQDGVRITSEQSKVIWQLARHDEMTTTDLSLATGNAKNTLSVMLKKLEVAGFIQQRTCPNDGRKKYYILTEAGREQSRLADTVSEQLGEIFYRGLSEDEQKTFESMLERIVQNLTDHLNEGEE